MNYYYDAWGFLSPTPDRDRATESAPPPEASWPPGQRPNWTGYAWTILPYPPPQPIIPLATAQAAAIAAIRAEAATLIALHYPQWRQNSAALSMYTTAYTTKMQDDIAAVIKASNTAEDAIAATTTNEQAGAVMATWPTIT